MSVRQTVNYFWLPDDTEEDMVGADWHQCAIVALYDPLRDLADLAGLPWHVGNQLTLVGWTPGGSWRPSPDIMVHPTAGPELRQELSVKDEGPPALIIEVASPTTWHKDVNDVDGKAAGYLGLGVPEYLVFDPTGELLGTSCRGWQQSGGIVREWRPEPDGTYRSLTLGIAFRPEGIFLRVFDQAGRPMPIREERLRKIIGLTRENAAQAEELAARAWELAAQAEELETLRSELERLRAERQGSE